MSQRESQLLWLKDVIDHLQESCEQLEWTSNPEAARLLLDRMMQDMDCGKRLCSEIRTRTRATPSLAAVRVS